MLQSCPLIKKMADVCFGFHDFVVFTLVYCSCRIGCFKPIAQMLQDGYGPWI